MAHTTVSFTYFANGLRQTMADISGTTAYGYDTRTRLTSKQTPFGTLSYTYDNAGDVLTLASSNTNGASLTYAYDTLNRLSTVTDNRLVAQGATSGLTTYNYDPVGNLQNFVYPNGVTSAYGYDTLNRLTQMGSSKNSSAISNYAYTLGAAGNRTAVTELSGRNVSYGYDSLYRLTSEAVSADPNNKNGSINYTYDAVGNRKTLNATLPPAGGISYTYDADDRLGSDQYDNNGNTTLSAGVSDVYDFENHLIQKGGVTIVYDGDGNRVAETVGGVTASYLVDTVNPTGYAQVVDEIVAGTVTRTYAYGLERISENQMIGSAWTPSFYGYDGHGSVRQLTNSAGNVTDTYDYDAFGNLINQTGPTPNNYLFAGEQYDPALNLYYNRARYLNTATGRFWSMDTVEGDPQSPLSLHKYLYAEGNPIDHVDPSGHEIDEVLFAVAVSVVVLALSVPANTPVVQQNQLTYSTVLNDPAHHTWEIKWGLAHNSVHGGWIVQHILLNVPGVRNYNYWEAWQVLLSSHETTVFPQFGFDDMFRAPAGSTFNAEARFYEGLQLPQTFVSDPDNPDTAAGILPATTIDPNLPTTHATPQVNRNWVAP